jgi:hypothetical protein
MDHGSHPSPPEIVVLQNTIFLSNSNLIFKTNVFTVSMSFALTMQTRISQMKAKAPPMQRSQPNLKTASQMQQTVLQHWF